MILRWLLVTLGYVWWQKKGGNPYTWKKKPWVHYGEAYDPCGCRRAKFRAHVNAHLYRHGAYYMNISEHDEIGEEPSYRYVFKLYGTCPQLPRHMKEFLRLVNSTCVHTKKKAMVNWKPTN